MTQEEFNIKNAITPREVEKLKRTLRIGDIVQYEELEYVPEDRRLLVPRRKKSQGSTSVFISGTGRESAQPARRPENKNHYISGTGHGKEKKPCLRNLENLIRRRS